MTARRRGVLHAYVADAGGTLLLAFMEGSGHVHECVTLTPVGARTASERAFRGIVHALWNARARGYRRIVVHSDSPEAVAQINGERPVEPALIGPYLEGRALMHAYRWAHVTVGEIHWRDSERHTEPTQLSVLAPRVREAPDLAGVSSGS
jgi:hypothetical protein